MPRRCIHIGESNKRYPITLNADSSYKFSYQIKNADEKCRIIIGCDADVPLSVFVSGDYAEIYLQYNEVFAGFEYIPEKEIGKENHFIYAVSQAAPFVTSALLSISLDENEVVEIVVRNNASQTINILWIELSFE